MDSDIWFSLAGCESGPGGSTVLLPAGESPLTAASAPDSAGRVGLRLTVEDVDKSCDAAADRDRRVAPRPTLKNLYSDYERAEETTAARGQRGLDGAAAAAATSRLIT